MSASSVTLVFWETWVKTIFDRTKVPEPTDGAGTASELTRRC
jgi:hypothetical protein